jgi:hypothetical protein
LNKYFGSKNLIQRIRTKFAFHSDTESVALAYSSLPSVFKSVEYLSEYVGHTLFHTSETLGFIAIAGDRKDNWQEALDQIIQEITEIFFIFEIFITGFFNIIYKRHLGVSPEHLKAISIKDDPSVDDMRMPFFCLPPRGGSTIASFVTAWTPTLIRDRDRDSPCANQPPIAWHIRFRAAVAGREHPVTGR